MNKSFLFISLMILILCMTACSDKKDTSVTDDMELAAIEGVWQGRLNVQGNKLTMVFRVESSDKGYQLFMDSPDQKITDIPVEKITISNDSIIISVNAVKGTFSGIVKGNIMDGSWSQGNMDFPLILERTDSYEKLTRPQDPQEPFPYNVKDITFFNSKDSIRLAGTVTYPKGEGPFPGVILISGSGPQNRNEEVMGHRPFLVLADFLTKKGYAVLRYDDRGIAESEGDYASATTLDFSDDAMYAFDYLESLNFTDNSRTGIVGHSEGGLIAPIVAAQKGNVDFIILLAGTGLPLEYVLYRQGEDVFRSEGYGDFFIQYQKNFQEKIFSTIKSSMDDKLIEDSLRNLYAQYNESAPDGAPLLTKEGIEANITALMSPWYRAVLTLDPRDYLSQVDCPVLAINGENDVQVHYKDNLREIENALKKGGNQYITVLSLPGINHMMQESQSGAVSEYGEIEQTISPMVLDAIDTWLKKIHQE